MQQQQLPALMAWNRTDQNTHATRTTNYTMQAKFTLATTSIRSMLFGLKAAARLAGQQSKAPTPILITQNMWNNNYAILASRVLYLLLCNMCHVIQLLMHVYTQLQEPM